MEFRSILSRLREANAKHVGIIAEAAEAETSMLLKGMGVKALGVEPVLTIEEFYLFRARGLMKLPGDPEYAAYLEQHPTQQRE